MPIATPQGTLDFKSVDKVTFVGASSNTVIDTTTGSLGVGVGVGGPTSNLHVVGNALITGNVSDLNVVSNVNMLHTSNTASIKLNSNVVTEFPRSKKLIKYPRVAMTSASTPTGYVVDVSDQQSGHNAWEAFDNNAHINTNYRWRTNNDRYTDNSSSGTPSSPTAAASTYLFTGSEAGDWISVEIPEKMKLVYFTITGIHYHTPYEGVIYGYNTTTSTWERVSSFINSIVHPGDNRPLESPQFHTDESNTKYYSKYAMIVVKTNGHHAPSMYEWKLYGIPEYDPEAHGTDVVVKSVPNVPNTDWLEVYYDAKDLATMPNTVTDLSPNTNTGAVSGHSPTLDTTGGVNSFVFDGTDDYITSTLTGLSSTQYTMAGWIKVNTLDSTVNTFFGLGDWASGDGRAIGIAITGDNVIGANVKGLADAKFSEVTTGEWYHVVADFTSGNDTHLYVNGKLVDTVAGTTFAIPTNPPLFIGSRANASGTVETARLFPGSIANFRLFNRVLTSDEIWQLYAYQKEYFGHGDLSMTLKAGRLGIGTSEPRAALDVRGRITREYNPGEIIETIQGKANGRYVKVQSGTYLLPNVGDIQDLTSTHTRINGSNFDYTPPPGTTRVIYEFWFFLRRIDDSPILHVAGRVDGSQVNDARHTFRHQTDNIGTDPQIWIYNHMCISIGEVTSDNIAGGQVATWNSPRTIDFSARIFSGSFDARLHKTNHWDGSGDDILVRPTIKITAIA